MPTIQTFVQVSNVKKLMTPSSIELNWSEDLLANPAFDSTYSMSDLVSIQKTVVEGINVDVYILAKPDEPTTPQPPPYSLWTDFVVRYDNLVQKWLPVPAYVLLVSWISSFSALLHEYLAYLDNSFVSIAVVATPLLVFNAYLLRQSRAEKAQWKAAMELLSGEVYDRDATILDLKNAVSQQRNEKSHLQTRFNALESDLKTASDRIKTLEAEKLRLDTDLNADKSTLQHDLDAANARVQALEDEKSRLSSAMLAAEIANKDKTNALKKDLQDKTNQAEEQHRKIAELNKTIEKLNKELALSQRKYQEAENKRQTAHKRSEDQRISLAAAEKALERANKAKTDLQTRTVQQPPATKIGL